MPDLAFAVLADALVVIHLGFVAFVVLGGVPALRWPRLRWLHLPAAAWGVWIEVSGWLCPLTLLEDALRARAGEAVVAGGFVERYLLAALYPDGLTRTDQLMLALLVLTINVAVYTRPLRRLRRLRRRSA